jgi:hypothetical protein
VLEKYPKKVKLVFKNFPLRNHKFSMKVAAAALAAGRQGKFWEFHDLLYKTTIDCVTKKFKKLFGDYAWIWKISINA